ncbi:MAG: radical SAM protein [Sumerlaeia bacterium]
MSPAQPATHPTNRPKPLHESIGVQLTWRCNAECAFCGTWSGPANRATMDLAVLERLVESLAGARPRLKHVELTGGEPFVVPDLLRAAGRLLHGVGLPYTIVTNGFWARDDKEVARWAGELPGLQRFVVSTDRWHRSYVPESRVVALLRGCASSGIEGFLSYSYARDEEPGLALLDPEVRAALESGPLLGWHFCPAVDVGRARRDCVEEVPASQADGPCHVLGNMMVRPDGRVFACCVAGSYFSGGAAMEALSVGRADEPEGEERWRARFLSSPLIEGLRERGPLAMLRERGIVAEAETFTSQCGACAKLQLCSASELNDVDAFSAPP